MIEILTNGIDIVNGTEFPATPLRYTDNKKVVPEVKKASPIRP